MSDGTRTLLVPTEDSQGEHYHVPGGCGGHRLTSIEATAEEVVTERGLRPCSANGCEAADIPLYDRCDGCGKPVFDPERHSYGDGRGSIDYCAACEDYRTNADIAPAMHDQYELRDPSSEVSDR